MTRKKRSPARFRRACPWLLALCCWLVPGPAPAPAAELRLAVAVSLAPAVGELCVLWQVEHPADACVINAAGSGTLARQIEQGARVDLFIPASRDWLDRLLRLGWLDGASVRPLAGNRLVFVGRPGTVSRMADLPRLRRIALGSPQSVPAGAYAQEALRRAGLYPALAEAGQLVLAQDVRQALNYAERGAVDGAFVYASDLLLARRVVALFDVEPQLHAPIRYPLALTAAGARQPAVRAFADFLCSPPAAALLARHGFTPAD